MIIIGWQKNCCKCNINIFWKKMDLQFICVSCMFAQEFAGEFCVHQQWNVQPQRIYVQKGFASSKNSFSVIRSAKNIEINLAAQFHSTDYLQWLFWKKKCIGISTCGYGIGMGECNGSVNANFRLTNRREETIQGLYFHTGASWVSLVWLMYGAYLVW